jgi:hypothetical protein
MRMATQGIVDSPVVNRHMEENLACEKTKCLHHKNFWSELVHGRLEWVEQGYFSK